METSPSGADLSEMIEWWDAEDGDWIDEFPGLGSASVKLDPLGADGDEYEKIFYWRWRFERGPAPVTWSTEDEEDTAVGAMSPVPPTITPPTITLPLQITVEQVD
jgi:hypothetical protein